MAAAPGWYPDPSDPTREWYWDGSAYVGGRAVARAAAATPGSGLPRWLVSWPAIVAGLVLCVIPGLVLLWLRPTSVKVKAGVTALTVTVAVLVGALNPQQPVAPVSASLPVVESASPSASESATPTATGSTSPSETSAPAPSLTPTPTPTTTTGGASGGTAVAAVAALPVKGRAAKTGYARTQFGPAWVDINRNGCDSRNDMLGAYLTSKVMSGSCKVLSGVLADPYTGAAVTFVYGGASEVDIDHLVALSDAWQKGAARWPYAKRVAFANDPLNLQPTDASANRQKSDSDAASWLPPNKSYRCTYVARQAAVKKKYGVWVTSAEKAAMLAILDRCPGQALPKPGPQPTIASNTGGPAPASSPTRAPTTKPSSGGLDPDYGTCKAAKAAGKGPYYQGKDPEYSWYTDRDHDGIVCE